MIHVTDRDGIRTLTIDRPPVNALNHEVLVALSDALQAAPGEGARGLMLSGAGMLFTAGLDVRHVLSLDAVGLRAFLGTFFGCLQVLVRSPIPVVAALNGASPAGGAVLALCCDWRVMARGAGRIGLNEVQVGLFPGAFIATLLSRCVGERKAGHLLLSGALLSPADAFACGLVDELADPESLHATACTWLEGCLAAPPQAFAMTRRLLRKDMIKAAEAMDGAALDALVEAWMAPEARAMLQAVTAKRKPTP